MSDLTPTRLDAITPTPSSTSTTATPLAPSPTRPVAPSHPATLLAVARQRQSDLLDLLSRAHHMDEDLVHDLRVSTRRVGEVVRVARSCLAKPAARALAAALQDLRHAAGELRDLDVLRQHIQKLRLAKPLHPLRRELLDELPAQRPALVEALQRHCGSTSLASAMTLLARVIDDPDNHTAAVEDRMQDELAAQIKKRRKQFNAALGDACRQQTPRALHAARIAAKKLRYLDELRAATGRGKDLKKELKFLKTLQQHLGDIHDTDVLLGTLGTYVQNRTTASPRGEPAAWRRFAAGTMKKQADAAAAFFAMSYLWKNNAL